MVLQKRTTSWVIMLAVCAAVAVVLFQPNGKKAAETLLRKGSAAIQTKDMDKLMPLISTLYKDNLGMTYGSLRAGFAYIFSQYHDITIDYSIQNITLGKDTVEADLLVRTSGHGLWGAAPQDIVGTQNDPEPVTILFKRDFIKWKAVGSRWPRRTAGMPEFN